MKILQNEIKIFEDVLHLKQTKLYAAMAKSFLKPKEINIRVLCHFWNDLVLVYKDKMCNADDDFGNICVACAGCLYPQGKLVLKQAHLQRAAGCLSDTKWHLPL